MEIEDHYGQLLGIYSPWSTGDVALSLENSRVDIVIEYTDDSGPCPECGADSPKHDEREERIWRHLDTMQFAYLHCGVPRVRCKGAWGENAQDAMGGQEQSLHADVRGIRDPGSQGVAQWSEGWPGERRSRCAMLALMRSSFAPVTAMSAL